MPFAVVQTTNVKGQNELSAVPEKWIRNSKCGNVMLWPNEERVQDLEKILRDDDSTPKKAWLKYKCKIKRNGLRSYEAAMNLCEELSGESSSDAQPANSQRKKKINNQEQASFQNMLVLNSTNPPPPPLIINLDPPVVPLQSTVAPLQIQAVSMQPPVAPMQESVIPQQAPAAPLQSQAVPMQPPAAPLQVPAAATKNHVSATQYVTQPVGAVESPEDCTYVAYETIHNSSALTDTTTQDLLKELIVLQHQVNHRLDLLEKRTADIAIQNEFILNGLRKLNTRTATIEEPSEFGFNPIEREEELAALELNLADNGYRSKMVSRLKLP